MMPCKCCKNRTKFYYDDSSPQSRSCCMLIEMLGIEDITMELINISNAEHLNEKFIMLNPTSTLPCLVDGNLTLFDSHVIQMFLCDKYYLASPYVYLPQLCPQDYYQRLQVLNMQFYESQVLSHIHKNLVNEIIENKFSNVNFSTHVEKIAAAYDTLEALLCENYFIVGNCFTIADISVLTVISSLNILVPMDMNRHPKLCEWFYRIKSLACNQYNEAGLENEKAILETQGDFPFPSPLSLNSEYDLESDSEDEKDTETDNDCETKSENELTDLQQECNCQELEENGSEMDGCACKLKDAQDSLQFAVSSCRIKMGSKVYQTNSICLLRQCDDTMESGARDCNCKDNKYRRKDNFDYYNQNKSCMNDVNSEADNIKLKPNRSENQSPQETNRKIDMKNSNSCCDTKSDKAAQEISKKADIPTKISSETSLPCRTQGTSSSKGNCSTATKISETEHKINNNNNDNAMVKQTQDSKITKFKDLQNQRGEQCSANSLEESTRKSQRNPNEIKIKCVEFKCCIPNSLNNEELERRLTKKYNDARSFRSNSIIKDKRPVPDAYKNMEQQQSILCDAIDFTGLCLPLVKSSSQNMMEVHCGGEAEAAKPAGSEYKQAENDGETNREQSGRRPECSGQKPKENRAALKSSMQESNKNAGAKAKRAGELDQQHENQMKNNEKPVRMQECNEASGSSRNPRIKGNIAENNEAACCSQENMDLVQQAVAQSNKLRDDCKPPKQRPQECNEARATTRNPKILDQRAARNKETSCCLCNNRHQEQQAEAQSNKSRDDRTAAKQLPQEYNEARASSRYSRTQDKIASGNKEAKCCLCDSMDSEQQAVGQSETGSPNANKMKTNQEPSRRNMQECNESKGNSRAKDKQEPACCLCDDLDAVETSTQNPNTKNKVMEAKGSGRNCKVKEKRNDPNDLDKSSFVAAAEPSSQKENKSKNKSNEARRSSRIPRINDKRIDTKANYKPDELNLSSGEAEAEDRAQNAKKPKNKSSDAKEFSRNPRKNDKETSHEPFCGCYVCVSDDLDELSGPDPLEASAPNANKPKDKCNESSEIKQRNNKAKDRRSENDANEPCCCLCDNDLEQQSCRPSDASSQNANKPKTKCAEAKAKVSETFFKIKSKLCGNDNQQINNDPVCCCCAAEPSASNASLPKKKSKEAKGSSRGTRIKDKRNVIQSDYEPGHLDHAITVAAAEGSAAQNSRKRKNKCNEAQGSNRNPRIQDKQIRHEPFCGCCTCANDDLDEQSACRASNANKPKDKCAEVKAKVSETFFKIKSKLCGNDNKQINYNPICCCCDNNIFYKQQSDMDTAAEATCPNAKQFDGYDVSNLLCGCDNNDFVVQSVRPQERCCTDDEEINDVIISMEAEDWESENSSGAEDNCMEAVVYAPDCHCSLTVLNINSGKRNLAGEDDSYNSLLEPNKDGSELTFKEQEFKEIDKKPKRKSVARYRDDIGTLDVISNRKIIELLENSNAKQNKEAESSLSLLQTDNHASENKPRYACAEASGSARKTKRRTDASNLKETQECICLKKSCCFAPFQSKTGIDLPQRQACGCGSERVNNESGQPEPIMKCSATKCGCVANVAGEFAMPESQPKSEAKSHFTDSSSETKINEQLTAIPKQLPSSDHGTTKPKAATTIGTTNKKSSMTVKKLQKLKPKSSKLQKKSTVLTKKKPSFKQLNSQQINNFKYKMEANDLRPWCSNASTVQTVTSRQTGDNQQPHRRLEAGALGRQMSYYNHNYFSTATYGGFLNAFERNLSFIRQKRYNYYQQKFNDSASNETVENLESLNFNESEKYAETLQQSSETSSREFIRDAIARHDVRQFKSKIPRKLYPTRKWNF